MIKCVTLASLFFFSLNVLAQIRFEEGYFINNDDSQTTCLIRNVDWLKNPTEFKYKLTESGEVMTAKIDKVKSFGVSKVKFIREQVKIDTSNLELNKLTVNRNPEWKITIVFLKVIVTGKANLYSYRLKSTDRFFFSVDNSPLEQLVYKPYLVSDNNKEAPSINYNLAYLQQLKMKVSCKEIPEGILRKIKYDGTILKKHITNFNICNGEASSDQTTPSKIYLSLTPGLDFQQFKLDNDKGTSKEFANSKGFRIGFEVESVLPFNRNKWSLLLEPTFQSYKAKDAQYTSIETPLGIRHSFFIGGESRIFINGLVTIDLPLKSEAKWSSAYLVSGKKMSVSFALGTGYKYKRFSIEGRKYFFRSILDVGSGYFTVYEKFSVIAGFRLK